MEDQVIRHRGIPRSGLILVERGPMLGYSKHSTRVGGLAASRRLGGNRESTGKLKQERSSSLGTASYGVAGCSSSVSCFVTIRQPRRGALVYWRRTNATSRRDICWHSRAKIRLYLRIRRGPLKQGGVCR